MVRKKKTEKKNELIVAFCSFRHESHEQSDAKKIFQPGRGSCQLASSMAPGPYEPE